jgi:formate hydrogenlyase subunit 3/multisubunit Na+/H+ antiporter MnhD subunit
VIHQTIANDYHEINSQSLPTKSDDREINKLLIGTGAATLLHVTWILISILAVTKLNDSSYPESEIKDLITWIIILYILSALVTFYVKFEIENSANPEENNGYEYINSLCQKSLLIPFAVAALIVIIAFFILKIVLQLANESSKQSSNTAKSSQMKVCRSCGAVKQGTFARCCGRHLF